MVHRFRTEVRHEDVSVEDAILATMRSAGRTIMLSGVAVAIGLATLLIVPVPFVRSLGAAGLVVPLFSLAAALTLQPALLSYFGRGGVRAARPTRSDVATRRRDRTVVARRARCRSAAAPRAPLDADRARRPVDVDLLAAVDAGLAHRDPAERRGVARAHAGERPNRTGRDHPDRDHHRHRSSPRRRLGHGLTRPTGVGEVGAQRPRRGGRGDRSHTALRQPDASLRTDPRRQSRVLRCAPVPNTSSPCCATPRFLR